jgi:hypothetical protein
LMCWPLRVVLNTAYAFLAEQADAADAVAVPAYQVAQVKPEDIAGLSARTGLDEWLDGPLGATAEHEQAVVAFLTS